MYNGKRDTNQKWENNVINLDITRYKWHMERELFRGEKKERGRPPTSAQTWASATLCWDNKRNGSKNDEARAVNVP